MNYKQVDLTLQSIESRFNVEPKIFTLRHIPSPDLDGIYMDILFAEPYFDGMCMLTFRTFIPADWLASTETAYDILLEKARYMAWQLFEEVRIIYN